MKVGAIVWSERSVDPDMQELLRPYYIKQLAKLRIGPGNILFLHAGTANMKGALEPGSMKLSEDGNSKAGDDLDPRSYINQFRKKGYHRLVLLEAPFWISDTQVLTDRLEGQKSPFMAIEDLDDDEPNSWLRGLIVVDLTADYQKDFMLFNNTLANVQPQAMPHPNITPITPILIEKDNELTEKFRSLLRNNTREMSLEDQKILTDLTTEADTTYSVTMKQIIAEMVYEARESL